MQPILSTRPPSTKLFKIVFAFSMVQMTMWHWLAAAML